MRIQKQRLFKNVEKENWGKKCWHINDLQQRFKKRCWSIILPAFVQNTGKEIFSSVFSTVAKDPGVSIDIDFSQLFWNTVGWPRLKVDFHQRLWKTRLKTYPDTPIAALTNATKKNQRFFFYLYKEILIWTWFMNLECWMHAWIHEICFLDAYGGSNDVKWLMRGSQAY